MTIVTVVLFVLFCWAVATLLALRQAPLWKWAAAVALLTLLAQTGAASGEVHAPVIGTAAVFGWLIAAALGALAVPSVRQRYVLGPAYSALKKTMPSVSETERQALEAGSVGWDAELFSGAPDWSRLARVAPPTLSDEERQFLDGPTEELCRKLDDWDSRRIHGEVPDWVWRFAAEQGFFGMLISKEHGGLGFSAQAQSLIIGKIISRSPDAGIVVMVPNSLGPGELIEKYGTEAQKSHYLPRLAKGEEIPCFALTGPFSGSDAAAMRDTGVVCHGRHGAQEVLGIRLRWDKRYISLAPKATLLGLAFRLFDPDGLLGDEAEIGITLALVPTDHEGVEIGRRHLPGGAVFSNGPTWGNDVFIPLDWVIGGGERAGQGWRMLMECLSAGRSISLPATSAASAKAVLRASTAYAQIRKQFGLPIAHMEGIEEPLARLVETAYVVEAARSVTASMVSAGEKPAVISALLKYQSTERMRAAVNDAFDIHGGRAICDGPSNYMQAAYQTVPVAITVEGANILTRTLITFTQGALRSHPLLYREIEALQDADPQRGQAAFNEAFGGHVAFAVANLFGALFHNVTGGLFASAPAHARATRRWYRQLARASRSFALVADLTVAALGDRLKVRQKLTGRLADALGELYLLSCVLKRFEDDGAPAADLPIVEHCARNALYRFQVALRGTLDNFPLPKAAWLLRLLVFPLGARLRPASDRLGRDIVRAALAPGEVRDRLTRDIFIPDDPADPAGILEHTLPKVIAAHEADRKLERAVRKGELRRTHLDDWIGDAEKLDIVTAAEAAALREVEALVARAIAVDHFAPDDIAVAHRQKADTDNNSEGQQAAE